MTTNTNTTKNTANSKEAVAAAMHNAKAMSVGLFHWLRRVLRGMKFWTMALICLGFRCFVKYPIGPLFALVIGTVWAIENWATVGRFFQSVGGRVAGAASSVSRESTSMWYELEGERIIDALIAQLNQQGISYCNLVKEMEMPPQSHWHAISVALTKKGIRTQVTQDAFFIAWNPQGEQA